MADPVIVWFRDDLRLADHAALHAAIATGGPVLPVYVLDNSGPHPLGGAARWWLHHSLASLSQSLRAIGGVLVLRRGPAADVIPSLVGAAGAVEVFTGGMADPFARATDRAISDRLVSRGVQFHRMRTATLFRPDRVRTRAGNSFSVYTPFSRACLEFPAPEPLPAPLSLFPAAPLPSERLEDWGLLPTHPDWAGGLRATWTPGERGARDRLDHFISDTIASYETGRDFPGMENTSRLSPHLRFGEISAAQAMQAVRGRADGKKFVNELLWREFCQHLLWHHPSLPEAPLRPEFAAMPWRNDPAGLLAWQRGRTGFPIVDAGMRQLWETGWMHNRVRMIVASFLVKHLLIDWRLGQAWFWDTLVDADLANNSASWQWVAGSGADAAPYFRIFNPVLQGKKFDPDGTYVRRFVPELFEFDERQIHMPRDGAIVELAAGREQALAAFASLKKSTGDQLP